MNDVTVQEVPEVAVGTDAIENPAPTDVPKDFSGQWGDFQKDIAAIAAETPAEVSPVEVEVPKEVQKADVSVEAEPTQPDQTQAVATPEVPKKFQAPDGKVNEKALDKSLSTAEEKLAKYLEVEKELKRKQNEIGPLPAPVQTQAQPPSLDSFAKSIEEDVKLNGLGVTLAKLAHAAEQSAYARAMGGVEEVRMGVELNQRRNELQDIAKHDPWILSQEGIERLTAIRQAKPWLNQAPLPWTEAYKSHLADQAMSQRSALPVPTQTPKAVTAPSTPVTAAGRVAAPSVKLETKEQIMAHLSKLTPEQEAEFWRKQGHRWPSSQQIAPK